jgi:predicted DNA-binding transcriptional regulator AlpA
MPNRPDLATVLADPTSVPVEQIADAIGELEKAKAILWSRLGGVSLVPSSPPARDGTAPLLKLAEAAGFLGKSPAWLRRKAAEGAIPCARKVGRSWRFPAPDLERYVDRMRQVG